MVFSSLLFVYLFLPINIICYAVITDINKKNNCILIFSLIFYAWTSPKYLLLLILMAFVNYYCALLIEKHRENGKNRRILIFAMIFNVGILVIFKYLGFFTEIINSFANIIKVVPNILLPVGISFYTFQLISYVVDVYRGDIKADKRFRNILLYTSLFHQCIAGPIVRYKDIARDLQERKTDIITMSEGISRFCVGLAKKTLLANYCASLISMIMPATIGQIKNITVSGAWISGLLYMFEIYLDFSAYSDMAIGLGKMTGFNYKENFNYPYMAHSVTDFWRRWHISLSSFFKDYIYIPLGGNRLGIKRQIFNMFIVWSMTGLWHGASWNFVLWGVYFFIVLTLEKVILKKIVRNIPIQIKNVISHIYTIIIVFFSWMIFRFTDLNVTLQMLRSMFGLNNNQFTSFETNTLLVNNIIFLVICAIAVTPLAKKISSYIKNRALNDNVVWCRCYNILNVIIPIVLLLLATFAMIGNSYNPFIYFRF